MATYSGTTTDLENQHSEYGRQGARRSTSGMDFNQIKTTVADKLHGAAQMLQEKAARDDSATQWGQMGQRAGDWLNQSADYINDLEPQRLRTDIENQVRQNPGRSLLIAGAAGLLLGRLLRGR